MRVVLHIGHSKAGSSSIQRFLIDNQAALLERGVATAGKDFEFSNETEIRRPPNFWLEDKAKDPESAGAGIREALEKASQDRRVKIAVISAETLGRRERAALFEGMADRFDLKVLHYVRRQDAWIYAAWKQWQVKAGLTLEEWVEQCLTRTTPDYEGIWSAWTQSAIPEEAYEMVWLNEKTLTGGDLLTDFCARAGIDGDGLTRPGRINPGFDPALMEVFQRAPFLFEGPHDNVVYRYLEDRLPEEAFVSGRMPFPLAKAVMDSFRESNETLRRRFAPDVDHDALFGLEPPADESGESDIDRLYRAMGYVLHLMANEKRGKNPAR